MNKFVSRSVLQLGMEQYRPQYVHKLKVWNKFAPLIFVVFISFDPKSS